MFQTESQWVNTSVVVVVVIVVVVVDDKVRKRIHKSFMDFQMTFMTFAPNEKNLYSSNGQFLPYFLLFPPVSRCVYVHCRTRGGGKSPRCLRFEVCVYIVITSAEAEARLAHVSRCVCVVCTCHARSGG